MRESNFARHYKAQALKVYVFQEGRARRPFVRLLTTFDGLTYLRIGPIAFIRDGWRLTVKVTTWPAR